VSIHRSLAARSKLRRQRNVLTRTERLEKLKDQGRWNEGDTVFGLPALKVIKIKTGKKKKKEKAAEAEAAAPAAESAPSAEKK